MLYRVLCLGDVVGAQAVEYISHKLWNFRKDNGINFTVANGENADPGNGITRQSAEKLLASGVDVITSGNHVWQKKEIRSYIDECRYLLRPANYPSRDPGSGSVICDADGRKILVMNVQGNVFMDPIGDPFDCVDSILRREEGNYDFSVLDIHAEATAEKIALARYFDGRINIIVGTHTHVQTADEQVLEKGSGYITDLGMSGVQTGVLGVDKDCIIEKFRTKMPVRFLPAVGEVRVMGAVFGINDQNGIVEFVKRVEF